VARGARAGGETLILSEANEAIVGALRKMLAGAKRERPFVIVSAGGDGLPFFVQFAGSRAESMLIDVVVRAADAEKQRAAMRLIRGDPRIVPDSWPALVSVSARIPGVTPEEGAELARRVLEDVHGVPSDAPVSIVVHPAPVLS
jgi:hypothetical protein